MRSVAVYRGFKNNIRTQRRINEVHLNISVQQRAGQLRYVPSDSSAGGFHKLEDTGARFRGYA